MKVRTRRLWINVFFKAPPDVSKDRILKTLLRGIRHGDYRYPKEWRVAIQWRNSENAEMRTGEWTAEMKASHESSPGFDMAVTSYLESRLDQ